MRFEKITDDLQLNLTPLMDTLFVLVAILMLLVVQMTAPKALHVKVPEVSGAKASLESQDPVIGLSAKGELLWGNAPVSLNELEHNIQQQVEKVVIQADESCAHGDVMRLVNQLQLWGVSDMTFEVQERKV